MIGSAHWFRYEFILATCLISAPSFSGASSNWLLGPIVLLETDRYHNGEPDYSFIPYIAWESERWHIGIDEISFDMSVRDDIRFSLLAEPRFSLDAPTDILDDLERDFALEAGGTVGVDFYPWTTTLSALSDVIDSHGGQRLKFHLSQEFPLGAGSFEMNLSTEFKSERLAMHLYGVKPNESNADLQAYAPGNVWNMAVSGSYFYQLGERTAFQFELELNALPKRLLDSPRLNERYQAEAYLIIVRQF